MTSDLSHTTPFYPFLVEFLFISSSLAVILIDWNQRLLLSYLPRWRCRNIRQDVYMCLFGVALAIMYTNSMNIFAFNVENCRIAGASFVVLFSFWLQSKWQPVNFSNKCVGTLNVEESHKLEEESQVTREKEVSSSASCEADILQSLLPLSSSSKTRPPLMNIMKEMDEPYVQACKSQYKKEELVTALKYMNNLRGGIQEHRDSGKLIQALEHIKNIEPRLNESGFFEEYSLGELNKILVENKWCSAVDLREVVKDFMETYGYPPSPAEFIEFYDEQKGIVQLKKDVKEKDQALESSQKKSMSLEQRLQQKDQTLQQKDRLLQQMRQRMRELEKGEIQKRMCEMEKENQHLSQRLMCKICQVEEVKVLFSPCNHLVSCQDCVPCLPKIECPICATKIQGTIKVLFA